MSGVQPMPDDKPTAPGVPAPPQDDRPTADELPTEAAVEGKTADRTDVANSEAMVNLFGDGLRFVGIWGKWLWWDGARWQVDDVGRSQECAVDTSRILLSEATEQLRVATDRGDTDAQRRARQDVGWAVSSQFKKGISAMVALAKSKPARMQPA